MKTRRVDYVIIGAGMAGTVLQRFLESDRVVVLAEMRLHVHRSSQRHLDGRDRELPAQVREDRRRDSGG
jgi:hypothetical protein